MVVDASGAGVDEPAGQVLGLRTGHGADAGGSDGKHCKSLVH
jgi:hypothetical protein